MTHAAARMHALVKSLGVNKAAVVGHDIGLMVAYAYAAQFPDEVDRLVLMDAFLPGVDGWETIYNNPAIWHFRFNGPTPEALVRGRERTYFEHFWNNFAADKTRSLPEADRQAYTTAYARPGRMRAAWAYFVSFQQAAMDFARLSQTKLTMPVLSIGGEKANGAALGRQVQLVATNARSVTLPNTGHWVMEESPQATMDALVAFLQPSAATARASTASAVPSSQAARSTLPQMRLTPDEVRANQTGTEQVGSSFLAGVSTKVLAGDPSKPGFYTIILSVPANTTIPAHSHRDDRMATVVSGTWQFGYGDRFDENALKRLPPGSVYLGTRRWESLCSHGCRARTRADHRNRTDRHSLRQSVGCAEDARSVARIGISRIGPPGSASVDGLRSTHVSNASSAGHSACPQSVRLYSTFGVPDGARNVVPRRRVPCDAVAESASSRTRPGSNGVTPKIGARAHRRDGRGSPASIDPRESAGLLRHLSRRKSRYVCAYLWVRT